MSTEGRRTAPHARAICDGVRWLVATLLLLTAAGLVFAQSLSLPNKPNSLKFAVIGDNGTGDQPEYEVGAPMVAAHKSFPLRHGRDARRQPL